jgi:ubiquinone/menaquinone biosynthesis C-methylase UbiE
LRFLKGYLEYLDKAGVEDSSVDLVISNCVINLCPRKDLALKAAYRALREGGELHFADVYSSRWSYTRFECSFQLYTRFECSSWKAIHSF